MKKSLLIIVLLLSSLSVLKAQDFKGRFTLEAGGGIGRLGSQGINLSHLENNQAYSKFFSAGYFLNNNLQLGLRYTKSKLEEQDKVGLPGASTLYNIYDDESKVEVFAKYHHWFSKKFAFTLEGSLGYSDRKVSEYNTYEQTTTTLLQTGKRLETNNYSLDTRLGILYSLNKWISFELSTPLIGLKFMEGKRQDHSTRVPSNWTGTTNWQVKKVNDLGASFGALSNLTLGIKLSF